MPKLNDAQRILLATAAQRDSGSLYPLPDTLKSGARITIAITALMQLKFAEERETNDAETIHRTDVDLRYGVFATAAGLAAIGIGGPAEEPAAPADAPRQSKASQLIALLRRDDGATLVELTEATGWLPHTTRAALTGLRKKGHAIERTRRGDSSCYRITASAA